MKNSKKLTVAQSKVLERNGVHNPREYFYVKSEYYDNDGSGNVGSSREKTEVITIRHRVSGDIRRIEIVK